MHTCAYVCMGVCVQVCVRACGEHVHGGASVETSQEKQEEQMGSCKGAGFDEILANARGAEGEEALVRELCYIRIYNRLAYLPLDLQGYLGS